MLLGGEGTQHEVDLRAAREVVAQSDAQARIVLAYELLYVAQAVVRAGAAARLEAQGAQGQRQVVGDDEQAVLVDVLLVEPVAHGVAAQIHIGGGLEQEELASAHTALGHIAVAAVVENNIGRFCESVQYHIADVVAGGAVFGAGVAQTHNQIFVHRGKNAVYSAAASSACEAADMAARVRLMEHTITSLLVAISRPSYDSSPTLMLLPMFSLVTSTSSFSGICL